MSGDFIRHDYIDKLTFLLRLTPYQAEILKNNADKYNIGRLEKRGGVVYVPHMPQGVVSYFFKILRGVPADLIGQNKMLVKNVRNVKFCNDGYHCVQVGRYKYYADAMGHNISREQFLRRTER